MSSDPLFPNLGLTVPEGEFCLRLWQTLTAGGHLLALDHVRASVLLVDQSFQAKPIAPQQT